jgi:hypothetical protein
MPPALPTIACAYAGRSTVAAMGRCPETSLTVPAAFSSATAASPRQRQSAESRALHYLGEISYATYLGHFRCLWCSSRRSLDDAHAIPLIWWRCISRRAGQPVALHHLCRAPRADGSGSPPAGGEPITFRRPPVLPGSASRTPLNAGRSPGYGW